MRILLLTDANSIHTQRWVKALVNSKLEIGVFTFYDPNTSFYKNLNVTKIWSLGLDSSMKMKKGINISKLLYLKGVIKVKEIIKLFKPDIVHAHYSSSYGLLGSLSGFHPFILSVWGADIYNFPYYSPLHSWITKFNLIRADQILSTSETMKNQTKSFTKKKILVTPFGIDVDRFFPFEVKRPFANDDIVIGTIKSLEKKYGIEYLIKAFHKLKLKLKKVSLKLLIVGDGSQKDSLKNLVKRLDIEKLTVFSGFIEHEEIPLYHNIIDIPVFPSIDDSESFGVSILEASACAKPVIVSNVGGLPEVVIQGETGIIVKPKSVDAIVEALEKLVLNTDFRRELGQNGREWVLKTYDWNDSVNKMITVYKSVCD